MKRWWLVLDIPGFYACAVRRSSGLVENINVVYNQDEMPTTFTHRSIAISPVLCRYYNGTLTLPNGSTLTLTSDLLYFGYFQAVRIA